MFNVIWIIPLYSYLSCFFLNFLCVFLQIQVVKNVFCKHLSYNRMNQPTLLYPQQPIFFQYISTDQDFLHTVYSLVYFCFFFNYYALFSWQLMHLSFFAIPQDLTSLPNWINSPIYDSFFQQLRLQILLKIILINDLLINSIYYLVNYCNYCAPNQLLLC